MNDPTPGRTALGVLLLLCVIAASCAGVVDPAALHQPARAAALKLPDGFTYTTQHGVTKIFLASGEYVAELEGEQGVFFRGPTGFYYQADTAGTYNGLRCDGGIFVPRSSVELPRVYYYSGSERQAPRINEAGPDRGQTVAQKSLLVGTILALEKGKIKFFFFPSDDDQPLRSALRGALVQ